MRVRLLLFVAVTTLFAAACTSSEHAAQAAIRRGDEYLRAGRASAAVIEYRNAVKRQPTRAEAYRKLGDAYTAEGDGEEAYRAYSSAADLDPNDTHSRVETARLLFAAGRYSDSLLQAEQVLERNEPNTDAAIISARALAKMNRNNEATARLKKAIAIDPAAAAYAALGDVRLAVDDRQGAETAFRAAVLHAPQSADARIALANFLSATGRAADAEAEYKTAVAINGTSEVANRALASFYISAGRDRDAEPYLRTAAAQPNQQMRSTLALADYYFAAERYDDVRRVLEPLTSGAMVADARVRLAAVAFRTGATADARRLLDRAMKKGPTAEAYTLNAQMLQAEHKTDEALASARSAIELDQSAVVAQYIVGSIELERGDYDAAEAAFEVVAGERQWAPAATVQLARVKLASGHPADAVALAESAGSDYGARLTLARALIADGQASRARDELRRLASVHPAAPEPPVLLGSLALTAGDVQDARAQATRALTLAPAGADVLLLAARASVAEGDLAAAEQYLIRAVAANSGSVEAHAMLGNLYLRRGDVNRAQRILQEYVKQHGDVAAAQTALGTVLEKANRPKEARAAYEQALALDPADATAANNLARLYANDDAQVPRALDLARTAASALPNDADAHDTLGWIAFRAGSLSLAASELQRAVALNGREPLYQNHLRAVRRAIEEDARAQADAARARKSEQ